MRNPQPDGAAWGRCACLLFGMAAALGLVACDAKPQAAAPGGEVLARVNGEAVTASQLADRLAAAEGVSTEARRRELDRMIDERLLAQKALGSGLDRDPRIRQALERARTELLAQAALELSPAEARVPDREVAAFYLENPGLFAERRIYHFRRFVLARAQLDGPLKARLNTAKNAAEVEGILAAAGIDHAKFSDVSSAESLPSNVLSHAMHMKPGDILMFRQDARLTLLQLEKKVQSPFGLDAATPAIRAYLAGTRQQHKAELLLKSLRQGATIEYVDQVAGGSSTALAESNALLIEPNTQKSLQPQVTVVR